MEKQSPVKKLFLLIFIFIVGILSLIILNLFFTKLTTQIDNKSLNLESKISIAEFIVTDLYKIRSDFYELTVTATNEKARLLIKKRIRDKINFIREALDVLENGGTLKRVIRLNIAGHLDTMKIVKYKKEDKDSISLEAIDLKPKLQQIEVMIKELEKLLQKRALYKESKKFDDYLKNEKEISRFYKNTPSFFIRVIENSSRSLYEGNIELKKLQKAILFDKNWYFKIKLVLIILIIVTILYLGFKIAKQINHTSLKILKQEFFTRGILDAQSNIVVVSDGDKMIDANKALVDFFDDFNSFDDFKKKHACICDFFEKIDIENFLVDREIDGKKCYQYILDNPDIDYKVAMKSKNELRYFKLKAIKTSFDNTNSIIIVSLSDITTEFNVQNKLKELNDNLENIISEKTKELKELNENLENRVKQEIEKNRAKDKKLIEQSRYASMGEMIANIAHQWRQPLSAISSSASSTKLQLDLHLANEEEVKKSLDKIMDYVQFLTKTIEDFRNFFRQDREKTKFNIIDILNNSISLIEASYKNNDIEIITNFSKNEFLAFALPNELSQVFLNILNNSKDALINKNLSTKLVNINIYEDENFNIIEVHDNAFGIEEEIITKIFDPYFTTKHKSQGTGIGLYMTKEIIEKHMNGLITVQNNSFTINSKEYYGACFTIFIPKEI